MRRHVLLACFVSAMALSSAPRLAHADDAAVAEAQERFKEGLELADQNKHEPARLKFQQAYAVFKAPAVLYNALEHSAPGQSQPDRRQGTDAMREKARQNVEDLAKRVISPAASCWPARSRHILLWPAKRTEHLQGASIQPLIGPGAMGLQGSF